MRNVARLKMGYYPLPESEGTKLRSLPSYSLPASVMDPCVGQGTALQIVTKDAPARLYGVELDAERARIATARGIETVQGNTFDAIARSESFSLLYLNPPYDFEIGSIANRRMEAVFLEHTYCWLTMQGVLVFVIPFERLHDWLRSMRKQTHNEAAHGVGTCRRACRSQFPRIDFVAPQ